MTKYQGTILAHSHRFHPVVEFETGNMLRKRVSWNRFENVPEKRSVEITMTQHKWAYDHLGEKVTFVIKFHGTTEYAIIQHKKNEPTTGKGTIPKG